MKFFISITIFSLALINYMFVAGQSAKRTITGVVTSFEESFPLEGVRISVKGTTTNSGTQPDGIYYINVDPSDTVLVFSLDGYQSKEIKISKSNEYNVALVAGGNQSGSALKIESEFYPALLSRCCP